MQGQQPYTPRQQDPSGARPVPKLTIKDVSGTWSNGFSNRILLALQSGLPNEQIYALNALIKVSAKEGLHALNNIPPLQDAIVDLLNANLDQLWDVTAGNPDADGRLLAIKATGLLPSDDIATAREMAMGAFHVLCNFTWSEQNAETVARDSTIVDAIELSVKLGQFDKELFGELLQYSLNLLDRIANRISVDPRNDALVSSLCKSILEPDRREVIAAIRSLLRLCHRDSNSKEILPIANTDEIVERLVSFLLVRANDGELAYYAVELLLRIAQGAHAGSKRILDIGGNTVVRELLYFLRDEAKSLPDPFDTPAQFVAPAQLADRLRSLNATPAGQSVAPPANPTVATAKASGTVPGGRPGAVHWITSTLEKGTDAAPLSALFESYEKHCGNHGTDCVQSNELLELIAAQLGSVAVTDSVSGAVQVRGVRLKQKIILQRPNPPPLNPVDQPGVGYQGGIVAAVSAPPQTLPGEDRMEVDPSPALMKVASVAPSPGQVPIQPEPAAATKGGPERVVCEWKGCGQELDDLSLLQQHVISVHVNGAAGPLTCSWKTCRRYTGDSPAPDGRVLAEHVKTHDPWAVPKPAGAKSAAQNGAAPRPPAGQNPGYTKPPPIAVTCAVLLANLVAQDSEHRAAILEEPSLSLLGLHNLLAPYIAPIMANSLEL